MRISFHELVNDSLLANNKTYDNKEVSEILKNSIFTIKLKDVKKHIKKANNLIANLQNEENADLQNEEKCIQEALNEHRKAEKKIKEIINDKDVTNSPGVKKTEDTNSTCSSGYCITEISEIFSLIEQMVKLVASSTKDVDNEKCITSYNSCIKNMISLFIDVFTLYSFDKKEINSTKTNSITTLIQKLKNVKNEIKKINENIETASDNYNKIEKAMQYMCQEINALDDTKEKIDASDSSSLVQNVEDGCITEALSDNKEKKPSTKLKPALNESINLLQNVQHH